MSNCLFLSLLLISSAGLSQPNQHFLKSTQEVRAYITNDNQLVVQSRRTGKQLLSLDFSLFEGRNEMDSTSGLEPYYFEDMNFDGYEDLIYYPIRYFSRFQTEVYLYKPQTQRLEYSALLSKIPCLSIYDKTKKILSSYPLLEHDPYEHWMKKYQWQNGKLILIEESGIMRDNKVADVYFDYIKKRINGKMIFTRRIKKNYSTE